jgi:hypothetical protein
LDYFNTFKRGYPVSPFINDHPYFVIKNLSLHLLSLHPFYLIRISFMTDLSTIRVIPFYGKSEEWPTWSERFLAKARCYGFNDVLLGKVKVSRTDEEYDMGSEEGKKLTIAADMNELAYTELILSIDDKTSRGKVAFNLVKGCKNKDYADGNANMAWERLKNKFEPSSAPSLVRQRSFKKGKDPDICITGLEDYRMRLDELGSSIADNQLFYTYSTT